MGENKVTTIAEAVHKIQLALLDGIEKESQLFGAGSLISRNDYNDVITERTIANQCGYPLCRNTLPPVPLKKGNYRVSLKEHKVYDVKETYLYCGSNCLINSKAFAGSLLEERLGVLNVSRVNSVLRMFGDVGVVGEEEEEEEKKAEIVILDKGGVKGGEVKSGEEWMGASNAIEGYVPHRDRRSEVGEEKGSGRSKDKNIFQSEIDFEVAVKPNEKSTIKKVQNKGKSTQLTNSEFLEPLLSEINFTSTIITNDEYAVSKEKFNVGSKPVHSGIREAASKQKQPASKKGKESLFGSMDFMSTIMTEDEYCVSKLPPGQHISDSDQVSQEFFEKLSLSDSEKRIEDSQTSVDQEKNSSLSSQRSVVDGSAASENESVRLAKVSFNDCENNASSSSGYVKEDSPTEHVIYSSNAIGKSSLRTSGSKRIARSVSWADDKLNGVASGNLCEFEEVMDAKEGPNTLRSNEMEEADDSLRFASAEACATALIQASESVASGKSDAIDAVSEAGITVLRQHEVDGEEWLVDEEMFEERDSVKWPEKPDNPNSEPEHSDSSWFDPPPEGFSVTLSPFAMMWNALFSWMTSSSLAYIYGRDGSFHEEYMSVNGREYPSKVVLPDGCSSEIKKTLAGCLARALPGLITDLKLPTQLSTLENGLICLLDTMSFMDALPSFRMRQWQVIVLLFIDALSVCRMPSLTPHLTSRRILIPKLLKGAHITAEEYEIMKDIVIPLGRVPQFSMQSGG